MKRARAWERLPQRRCRPEISACPHGGGRMVYSQPVWSQPIQSLGGGEQVTSLGFRCGNAGCRFGRAVDRSARAEARQVRGSG